MSDNKFKCAGCGGVFGKGWTDEEAAAETKRVFGNIPMEECDILCDDCYKKVMKHYAEQN